MYGRLSLSVNQTTGQKISITIYIFFFIKETGGACPY